MNIIDLPDHAAMPVYTIAFTDDIEFVEKMVRDVRFAERLHKRGRRMINPDTAYRWMGRLHVELEKI